MKKSEELKDMYYNRVMSPSLEDCIMTKFKWLIDEVKKNPELDFQTGSNNSKTWFSVYRGTGRILTINTHGKLSSAKTYLAKLPDFYKNPDLKKLDMLLDIIHDERSLDRYYMSNDGKKKEGYYQNLISRRYSLFCRPDDEFIIIDKEFVLGYKSDKIKNKITKPIIDNYKGVIKSLEDSYSSWFKNVKEPGTECDFVALTRDGDIMLLELKRYEDTKKIYLSPLQAGKYDDLTKEYANRFLEDFRKNILLMVQQKKRMGILNPQWELPSTISEKIIPAVVVGGKVSEKVKERFKIVRDAVDKQIPLYTCNEDGTLIRLL